MSTITLVLVGLGLVISGASIWMNYRSYLDMCELEKKIKNLEELR